MKTTKEWIEDVTKALNIKEKHGKGQELANALEIGLSTALDQLKGNSEMNAEQANRVARLLKTNPMLVVSSTSYHKCKKIGKNKDAENWENIYKRILMEKEQTETME